MRQVTKSHLYHLLGVSDYYVMYRQRAKSILRNICKGHQLRLLIPLLGCVSFCENVVVRGREF